MKWLWKLSVLAIAVIAIAVIACSDDDPAAPDGDGNGTTDTQAPGVDSVVAVDANHVEVYFNEAVLRPSAEQVQYYTILEAVPARGRTGASPGDTLHVNSVSLKADNKTAALQTSESMQNLPYEIFVCCVKDVSGNEMSSVASETFTGTTALDNTAPEIVYRSPAPGATGVGTGQSVVVQFSEVVRMFSVLDNFSWTGGAGVSWDMENDEEITFIITPTTPLSTNTMYTVTFTNVSDYSNNVMPTASWSFRTTPTLDTTAPTLVSSNPADGQRNVDVNTNLVLTFSEAIDKSGFEVLITPNPGDGEPVWSNGAKTVTFDPIDPLADDTQYYLLIAPGDIHDLAGNGIEDGVSILFTTGSSFATGSFAGTVSGDPGTQAANPAGTLVFAPNVPPFDSEGEFDILGSGDAGTGGVYSVGALPDGVYYPTGVLDSNGDDKLEPDEGDAVGGYGMDIRQSDETPDSVIISGGIGLASVNFPLFDQSALVGTFSYSGTAIGDYKVFIGAFEVNGFDINNLGPTVFGTDEWWPYNDDFRMNEMQTEGFVPGNYYIGAYMDLDGNEDYDPATEPAGFHGGVPVPTALNLTGGRDALNVHIVLEDPSGGGMSAPVPWGSSGKKNVEWFERLSAIVRQATD